MKKILAALSFVSAISQPLAHAQSQQWSYDFGTATNSWTNGSSTNFLPAPSSGGGTARVRVGTGGGAFILTNNADFGAGSSLLGSASSNTSVNKFSIYDWSNPSAAFSFSFDMRLAGGSSGSWFLFAGNGASFANDAVFTGSESFLGWRMSFGADGAITNSNRQAGDWVTVNGAGISQSNNYRISIFGNNDASSATYMFEDMDYSLAAGTWDLWVGGTRVSTNLAKALLANGALIDSFMFYSQNSTGNEATISLDNITYANYAIPEPSTYALLALASAGVGAHFIRRRRR